MTSMVMKVHIRQEQQVLVMREHGLKTYYALVKLTGTAKRRHLKKACRSLGRAMDYRDQVLARLARARQHERSLQGRLWRLGKAIREAVR
jgi:hypothetical protein